MRLPQVLDTVAASRLLADFQAARGGPVAVDASAVERIGALCLQVLLAAHAQWRADGQAFSIAQASGPFAEGIRLAGAHELAPMEASA